MSHLFHLNMRMFTSSKRARVRAYAGEVPGGRMPRSWLNARGLPMLAAQQNMHGLPTLRVNRLPWVDHPPAPPGRAAISVAGFTEIAARDDATRSSLRTLAGVMFGTAPSRFYLLLVGTTARDRREYAAIAVARDVRVRLVGRISFDRDAELLNETEPVGNSGAPPDWSFTMPREATLDYRSVVYVVARPPGARNDIAVGFLHNTHNFQSRYVVMAKLPAVLAQMSASARDTSYCYLGGDFNVKPGNQGDRRQRAFAYDDGLRAARSPVMTSPRGSRAGIVFNVPIRREWGTTSAGNLYDYWFSTIDPARPPAPLAALPVPLAGLSSAVLDSESSRRVGRLTGFMSDHAGTLLRIM